MLAAAPQQLFGNASDAAQHIICILFGRLFVPASMPGLPPAANHGAGAPALAASEGGAAPPAAEAAPF